MDSLKGFEAKALKGVTMASDHDVNFLGGLLGLLGEHTLTFEKVAKKVRKNH